MAKRKALGRGLGTILPDVDEIYSKELGLHPDSIKEIKLELIQTNPYQPRKHFDEQALEELAHSIQEYGLIQPIIVYKKADIYILIAGERRLRACQRLNLAHIKALVADIDEEKLRELALIENIQREDLNPIELAHSYKDLLEHYHITQDELSLKIHKSRSQITNTLRLLNLNQETQKLIAQGKLSQGHAKMMVGLDEKAQQLVLNTILGQKLNVRDTEKLIQKMKNNKKYTTDEPLEKELQRLQNNLKKFNIHSKARQKELILYCDDMEKIKQLNKILE